MKFILLLLLICSMSAFAVDTPTATDTPTDTPTATTTATTTATVTATVTATQTATQTATATATQTPTATPTATVTSASPVTYGNPTLSPGVANSAVTRQKVCDGIKEPKLSQAEIDATTVLYGITPTPQVAYGARPNQGFVVVQSIPVSIGGSNLLTNRYPASTTSTYFSENRREELVVKLKELMCTNTWLTPLPLSTAQGYVNTSAWPRYYKQLVITGYPTPAVPSATPTPTNTPSPTPIP